MSVFFVFNGTAANVLALASALKPYQGVICSDVAHLNVDECGAYERLAGGKLLTVPSPDGKLTPALVESRISNIGVVHSSQPAAISITQATEYGTVYTADEIAALSRLAREHGLLLHMDGARLANAAAALGLSPGAFTTGAGVDILTLGGTKNGLIGGEAVIFADPDRAADFGFVRKQGMQLASKMRFVAAQFDALLTDDLWLRSAAHANHMAQRLHQLVNGVPGVEVTQRVQANAVFARIPPRAIAPLQEHFNFLVWNERTSEVRWMTAFDTTTEDVDAFAAAIAREVGRTSAGAGAMKSVWETLCSIWSWFVLGASMVVWLPLMALIRLVTRRSDPGRYWVGYMFRQIAVLMATLNPLWRFRISGRMPDDPRRPYLVVSNHESFVDILLISHLPWEMKWLSKAELFRIPVLGWLMRLAGDIPVDRGNPRSAAEAMVRCKEILREKVSVIIFPGGHPLGDRRDASLQGRRVPARRRCRRTDPSPRGKWGRHRAPEARLALWPFDCRGAGAGAGGDDGTGARRYRALRDRVWQMIAAERDQMRGTQRLAKEASVS